MNENIDPGPISEAREGLPRRSFLKVTAGAVCGAAFGLPKIEAAKPPVSKERPNILWITLEDTCPHFIGAYGDLSVHTPRMDELAAKGVRFTSAFSTAPVCSPSRSAIITGCLAETLGSGQHRSSCPIPDEIKGFPAYLRQAGYYTSNNAKLDYNFAGLPSFVKETWDESSGTAGWWKRNPGQSFFSVFNLDSSHQSRTMTFPYAWYAENVLAKLPLENRTAPEKITVPPFLRDTPEMRRHLSRVHNSINLTDLEIGQLLDRLKSDGLAEDTIVFCFADHGEGIPKGKSSAVGLGFQVPFFVYFPPKYEHLSPWPIGRPTDELISSSEDVAPTILSLAGLEIPKYTTGRPLLGSARRPPRPFVWGARNRIDESPDVSRCVTDGTFFYTRVFMPQLPLVKYQKYADVSDILREIRSDGQASLLNPTQAELLKPTQPVEYLYHLQDDPWEIHNLAGDPGHQATLTTMRQKLHQHLLETRDILFMPEYEMSQRSVGQLPYRFRMDPLGYPFEQVLAAAELVGMGPQMLSQQLTLLRSTDPTVRYWAAVGLDAQREAMKPFRAAVLTGLDDPHPSVRIAMAGIACRQFDDPKAREILKGFVTDEGQHPLAKLHALQTILYLGDKGAEFISALKEAVRPHVVDDNRSCAQEALHFLEGEPLYYADMAKWIPQPEMQPDRMVHFTH